MADHSARETAQHALRVAQAIQAVVQRPAGNTPTNTESSDFDRMITDSELRSATRALFLGGHYALAVEEGYKCLNNVVKLRSGLSDEDGRPLMQKAFSSANPRLRLNELRGKSQQDQQLGYMEIYAGCMTGIRNPRAHQHKYIDQADVAMELLTWANHLMRLARTAVRTRPRKRSS